MNSLYKKDGGGQESMFEELFEIEEEEKKEFKPIIFSQYWEKKEEGKKFKNIGPQNLDLNFAVNSKEIDPNSKLELQLYLGNLDKIKDQKKIEILKKKFIEGSKNIFGERQIHTSDNLIFEKTSDNKQWDIQEGWKSKLLYKAKKTCRDKINNNFIDDLLKRDDIKIILLIKYTSEKNIWYSEKDGNFNPRYINNPVIGTIEGFVFFCNKIINPSFWDCRDTYQEQPESFRIEDSEIPIYNGIYRKQPHDNIENNYPVYLKEGDTRKNGFFSIFQNTKLYLYKDTPQSWCIKKNINNLKKTILVSITPNTNVLSSIEDNKVKIGNNLYSDEDFFEYNSTEWYTKNPGDEILQIKINNGTEIHNSNMKIIPQGGKDCYYNMISPYSEKKTCENLSLGYTYIELICTLPSQKIDVRKESHNNNIRGTHLILLVYAITGQNIFLNSIPNSLEWYLKLGGKLIETNDIKSSFEQEYFYEIPFLVIPGGADVLHNNEGLPYVFFMEEELNKIYKICGNHIRARKNWKLIKNKYTNKAGRKKKSKKSISKKNKRSFKKHRYKK